METRGYICIYILGDIQGSKAFCSVAAEELKLSSLEMYTQ